MRRGMIGNCCYRSIDDICHEADMVDESRSRDRPVGYENAKGPEKPKRDIPGFSRKVSKVLGASPSGGNRLLPASSGYTNGGQSKFTASLCDFWYLDRSIQIVYALVVIRKNTYVIQIPYRRSFCTFKAIRRP
jgi:hypothetical protein